MCACFKSFAYACFLGVIFQKHFLRFVKKILHNDYYELLNFSISKGIEKETRFICMHGNFQRENCYRFEFLCEQGKKGVRIDRRSRKSIFEPHVCHLQLSLEINIIPKSFNEVNICFLSQRLELFLLGMCVIVKNLSILQLIFLSVMSVSPLRMAIKESCT